MPIPPWLVTRPAEHAQASESGLSAGIQAAHIWAQAAAERQRLAEAAKRSDMESALEQERLQQKSIYDAQKIAVDREYNKAALSQAQAKIEQTQANAARMAQQWTEQQKFKQQQLAETAKRNQALTEQGQARITTEQDREKRLADQFVLNYGMRQDKADEAARHWTAKFEQSQKEAADMARHREVMENRPRSGSVLTPELKIEDDLLRQKIVQANAQIKEADMTLQGNLENKKFQEAKDKLVARRAELIEQRKNLLPEARGFKPVMGKRQIDEAGETANGLRFKIVPRNEENTNDQEE